MKAAQIKEYGGVEVIEIVDIPKPGVEKDKVLIEVIAASINPFDYKVRSGMVKDWLPLTFPVTLGGDFSGKVLEVGEEVIDYKKEKFEEILTDFDAVYDLVGGEVTDNSFKVLKKGGVLVSMLGQPSEDLAKQYEVTAIGQGTKTNSEHLKRLAELID